MTLNEYVTIINKTIQIQYNTIQHFLYFFLQNGRRRPSWMSEIHFRSHFWPFQIDTQLYFFFKFLTKWLPSAILDVRNSLCFTFLAILDQYRIFDFFEEQNSKWLPAAILDVRKSLSISFLAISDRYATFFFNF